MVERTEETSQVVNRTDIVDRIDDLRTGEKRNRSLANEKILDGRIVGIRESRVDVAVGNTIANKQLIRDCYVQQTNHPLVVGDPCLVFLSSSGRPVVMAYRAGLTSTSLDLLPNVFTARVLSTWETPPAPALTYTTRIDVEPIAHPGIRVHCFVVDTRPRVVMTGGGQTQVPAKSWDAILGSGHPDASGVHVDSEDEYSIFPLPIVYSAGDIVLVYRDQGLITHENEEITLYEAIHYVVGRMFSRTEYTNIGSRSGASVPTRVLPQDLGSRRVPQQ